MVKPVKVRPPKNPENGPQAKESISQPDLQGESLQDSPGDQDKVQDRPVSNIPGNRPRGDSGQGSPESLTQSLNLSQNVDSPKEQPAKRLKHWEKGLALMNAGKPLAQPGAIQAILNRYEAGEPVQDIAKDINLTRQAVYRQLVQIPDWQHYQAASALADLDDAKEIFRDEEVRDGIVVSRAREQARIAQWTLERTARSIYGDKLQVEHSVSLETGDLLGAATDLLASVRRRKEKIVQSE